MSEITLSPTQLGLYRECPQKYNYKYIQGRVPIADDTEAMAFGRVWDDATGILWKKKGDIEPVVIWLNEQAIAGKIADLDGLKVAVLLRHYKPPIGRFTFIGNQDPKITDIVGVGIKTKSDTLLREKKKRGRLIVREAKTTSMEIAGDSPYWQTLQINIQVVAYWKAHKAYGVLYDVVKRPTIIPSQKDRKAAAMVKITLADPEWAEGMSKAAQERRIKEEVAAVTDAEFYDAYAERLDEHIQENYESYFQCRPIFKTKYDLARDEKNLEGQVILCMYSRGADIFPMFEHSCVSHFGKCKYLDACTGRASLHDDAIFEDVRWKKKPF
jgi:hypothetical protein